MNCSTLGAELLGLAGQLLQRGVQAVAAVDVPAAQRAQQLDLVVAGHAQRGARRHHAHDQAEHAGRVGTAVHQVAEEHRAPAARVAGVDGAAGAVAVEGVAELAEQLLELGPAAVHVADDVERALFLAEIVEQSGPGDDGRGDLVRAAQHVDGAEALPAQVVQAAPQLAALAADHVRAEVAVRAFGVALGAQLLRQVQDDGRGQHVVLAGQQDQVAAGLGLHVGRVDHGQAARGQALADDEAQHLEGGRGGGLVVLVVGDQAAAEVGGDHLGRPEVGAGEGRLA